MKKKNLSAKKKIHNFYLKKLNDPTIKRIYLKFKKNLSNHIFNNFCVAVSGGVDSLALSFLAKCYSIEKNKKIFFFIVDHKLRKSSTYEANLIKNKLRQFEIKSEILTIKKNIKSSNLQSFARENRYKLLFEKSSKKKINTVLTAHHEDDLLENFFIRLLRGSGLKGLISFGKIKSKVNFDDKIFVLRPLLNTSKKDLIYILKNTFKFNVDDPSNKDDKFLRVKVRKLISKLEKNGLSFNKFKTSLNNLSKSNNAIDYYVQENIKNNSSHLNFNKAIILNDNFFKQPNEIVFRSLSELIQKVGKKNTFARGTKIESLLNYLNSRNCYNKKTLSGCIIQKVENSVVIFPENK